MRRPGAGTDDDRGAGVPVGEEPRTPRAPSTGRPPHPGRTLAQVTRRPGNPGRPRPCGPEHPRRSPPEATQPRSTPSQRRPPGPEPARPRPGLTAPEPGGAGRSPYSMPRVVVVGPQGRIAPVVVVAPRGRIGPVVRHDRVAQRHAWSSWRRGGVSDPWFATTAWRGGTRGGRDAAGAYRTRDSPRPRGGTALVSPVAVAVLVAPPGASSGIALPVGGGVGAGGGRPGATAPPARMLFQSAAEPGMRRRAGHRQRGRAGCATRQAAARDRRGAGGSGPVGAYVRPRRSCLGRTSSASRT